METQGDLTALQEKIGYTFSDPGVLKRALVHSSAEAEDNQRLEFLGDAVVEIVVSEYLYNGFKQYEEGALSKIRAAIVTESALAKAADKIDLGDYIIFGRGEQKSKGKEKPSILSDAVEALSGAVYLDGGYENAKTFVLWLLSDVIEEALSGRGFMNYKSLLQEYFNKNGKFDIRYVVTKEEGPQHDKVFYIKLCKGKKEISSGQGKSKKQAEQDAAKNAIEFLNIDIKNL
jgi:ribonuclease-3